MSKKKTATLKKGSILTEEMLRARVTPIEHFESITPAAAELLAIEGENSYYETCHDVRWLRNISNEVAINLSRSKAWDTLNLDGLGSLSGEAAEALAKFKGEGGLSLNGLSVLSDKAAEALAKLKGEELSLNSLISLSDKAAEELGEFKGKKLLIGGRNTSGEYDEYDRATEIWGGAGEEMRSRFSENSNLNSDDKEIARQAVVAASDNVNERLSKLSDKAAEALAKFKGEKLYLNGLISLTDKAAEALAKCKAALFLNGVISLSDGAAEALAGRKGTVELQGLNELSEQGSLSLSENKSIVISDQLTRQIENVVKNHAQTTSTLTSKDQSKIRKLITSQDADNVDFACNLLASLNASEGDWLKLFPKTRIYKLLSNWEPKIWNTLASAMKPHGRLYGELKLQAQKRVNTRSSDYAVHQRYRDFLSDLIKVANDDVIDVLNFARKGLEYYSNKISDTAALKLANYKGTLELGISSLSDTPGHIALAGGAAEELTCNSLKQLSAKAAEALVARNRSELSLWTLKTLSEDTAAVLAKYKGEWLSLKSLNSLSDKAAEELGKFKGKTLLINGEGMSSTKLSDEAIASLAKFKGALDLDVSELSEKAAKALASHDGDLHLYIKKISDDICVLLAKHKGKISIFDPNGSFGYREKDYKISARGAKAFLEHGNADIDFGRYDLKRIVKGQGGGRDGDWYGA